MSRGSGCDKIPPIILGGIEQAFKTYNSWTNDKCWLDSAPELFVSVEIARNLFKKLKYPSVDMERRVKEACASSKRGRKRKSERTNGRFDILISRKTNGKPWCAIEVKSPVWSISNGLIADIERIIDVLDHRDKGGSIECGAIAFYSSFAKPQRRFSTARELSESFKERVHSQVEKTLKKKKSTNVIYRVYPGKFHDSYNGAGWQAFCIYVRARKSHKKAV